MIDTKVAERKKERRKILPAILGMLQGHFICQIVTAVIVIFIALPIGLNNDTGYYIFSIGGLVGYWISSIMLIICIVYLLVGAKRLEEMLLRDKDKKSNRMLEGSILTIVAIIASNILIIVNFEVWAFIIFGFLNIIAAAIFYGTVLLNFEKMIRKVREVNVVIDENKFLISKPLLIITTVIGAGFAIIVPIIHSITDKSFMRIDYIMIGYFVAMLLFGITGVIVIRRMKMNWITSNTN